MPRERESSRVATHARDTDLRKERRGDDKKCKHEKNRRGKKSTVEVCRIWNLWSLEEYFMFLWFITHFFLFVVDREGERETWEKVYVVKTRVKL